MKHSSYKTEKIVFCISVVIFIFWALDLNFLSIEKEKETVERNTVVRDSGVEGERYEYNTNPLIEVMDLSDVTDDRTFVTLSRMERNNHLYGEPVYVSKDDFYEYHHASVSLIGDSISEFSKTYLKRFMDDIKQDSKSGREMVDGTKILYQMVEMDRISDIMIFSLGNNASNGIDFEVLENVYRVMSGNPIIIPTIVIPYKGQERNRNRDLRKFVETHDNCYIADWNAIATNHPELIDADGIHPTGEGATVFAQLMFKTVIDVINHKKVVSE